MFSWSGQKVVSFLGGPKSAKTGPLEKDIILRAFPICFPIYCRPKTPPDPNIYTPQGEASSLTFWGPAGHPRDLAGLVRPSGNLYQKVPHFGADCARSGTKVPPQLVQYSGFLEFMDHISQISRFPTSRFPDFSISHLHISRFLDFLLPDFWISRFIFRISRFPNYKLPDFHIFVFSIFIFLDFLISVI